MLTPPSTPGHDQPMFPGFEPPIYRTRIYFALGVNGEAKIGKTGRPNGHRGGEMHFTELCSVPGDRITEALYHRKYKAERIGKTEWFNLSDRLLVDMLIMCVEQGRWKSVEMLLGILFERLGQQRAA